MRLVTRSGVRSACPFRCPVRLPVPGSVTRSGVRSGPSALPRYLAGPYWHNAFDFVDPADEPVVRKFFVDMIEHFGDMLRKERGR
jgi:hypothetical protein